MNKKDYVKQYREMSKNIPEKSNKKAEAIIDKLADVLVMMDSCKDHIDTEGCVTKMCQGNYDIDRENPWSRVYDSKAKLMVTLLEKLDKMLPDNKTEATSVAGEKLAAFVAKGKTVELR